jgi:Synaphin protein
VDGLFVCLQYKIVKKEEIQEMPLPEDPNPLMRKKKTPEELAAEAEAEDEDELTSQSHLSLLSFLLSFHFSTPPHTHTTTPTRGALHACFPLH